MPRQREEVPNAELGRLIIQMHPLWNEGNVYIDSTQVIRDHPQEKVDVLVDNPTGQPIAIEAKFEGLEVKRLKGQVEGRFRKIVDPSGRTIEAGISVVYPAGQTAATLRDATLRFAVHQLNANDEAARWPEDKDNWIEGSITDLVDAIETVSLSEKRIRKGGEVLEAGVRDASSLLQLEAQGTQIFDSLGRVLHQEGGEQTVRMAVSIVVNAFVFHYAIEGHAGIPEVASGARGGQFVKGRVINSWDRILKVNYWPIFSIAKEILKTIPPRFANPLLGRADDIAQDLLQVGATTFHDLAARMFQTLIMDRKFLATFYTLSESAYLLAELAVGRLARDWSSQSSLESLKAADFACGTGTLLSAVQRAIYRRIRRAGGDDASEHKSIMEGVLLGTDIMPAAAHLTASMLSSAHPGVGYDESLVRVLPYGKDAVLSEASGVDLDTVYVGALDLLVDQFGHSIFTPHGLPLGIEVGGKPMVAKTGLDRVSTREFPVEHDSFDLVIMNPPFTRSTGHEAKKIGVPIPSFAGFDTSDEEQRLMSKKTSKQPKKFRHGNAGLGSNFMELAHTKLKEDGILALVLPFAFVAGESWKHARESLSLHYRDILVVSIATQGTTDRAFSADTGNAECLVLARKDDSEKKPSEQVQYVNLDRRPANLIEAHEVAKRINAGGVIRGAFVDSGVAGQLDSDIGRVMIGLRQGRLQLPRQMEPIDIPIAPMGEVASRGKYHMDINGTAPRGAFDVRPWNGRGVPTYPTLWGHHARPKDGNRERRLFVPNDSYGVPRHGLDRKAMQTWLETASCLHHNLDFRLNSQSLAICRTPEKSIGGRAWPNVLPHNPLHELPLLLWGNSTLGLMLFWWCGVRQQEGRAGLKITALPNFPTIDARRLSENSLKFCEEIFSQFRDRVFLPANEAYRDDTRKDLDAAIFKLLELPNELLELLHLLRRKWCSEPSVHGGKSTKP